MSTGHGYGWSVVTVRWQLRYSNQMRIPYACTVVLYFFHSLISTASPLLRTVVWTRLAQNVYMLRFEYGVDKLLGLITRKRYDIEQSSRRKGTSLACPLLDRMNPNVQKCILCAVTPVTRRTPKIDINCCFGKSDPLTEKFIFRYETMHADTDSRIPATFCGNP